MELVLDTLVCFHYTRGVHRTHIYTLHRTPVLYKPSSCTDRAHSGHHMSTMLASRGQTPFHTGGRGLGHGHRAACHAGIQLVT